MKQFSHFVFKSFAMPMGEKQEFFPFLKAVTSFLKSPSSYEH